MTAKELRTGKERTLFVIAAVLSGLAWLAIVISIVGLLYAVFIGLFVLMAHALFLAHVRGNGVKLGPGQLSALYKRAEEASRKLGLGSVPDIYILQAGGLLNAFATKLLSRNFVVIYSNLLDACGDDMQAVDMVVGHEIGHLAAGHLRWNMFLLPARILPWLGPAYSRAREYTCDLCGLEVVGDPQAAVRGLVVLAAGGRYAREVSVEEFLRQRDEAGNFWMAIYELVSTHPYLCKRVAAVLEARAPGKYAPVGRNPFAYPLAPFLGMAAAGPGGAAGGLVMVFVIFGILAAIAMPNFIKFQQRMQAQQMQMLQQMQQAGPDAEPEPTEQAPADDD